MNSGLLSLRPVILSLLVMATLSACSSAPQSPPGLAGVRDQLNKLQASGELAVTSIAPGASAVTVLLLAPVADVVVAALASVPALVVQVMAAPGTGLPAASHW